MSDRTLVYDKKVYATEREMLIAFLDVYSASEKFSSEWLGKWLETTRDGYVKGGLQVLIGREKLHVHLLDKRLAELGGTRKTTTPEAEREEFFAFYSSPSIPELEKFRRATGRIVEPAKAVKPITKVEGQLEEDLESKQMLVTILHDEYGTIDWLREGFIKYGGTFPAQNAAA